MNWRRLVELVVLAQGTVVTNFGLFYLVLSFFKAGQHVVDGMVIVSSGLAILGGAIGLRGWHSKLEGQPGASTPPAGGGQ